MHTTQMSLHVRDARDQSSAFEWHRSGGIVGHKTAEMAFKYTEKRRRATGK